MSDTNNSNDAANNDSNMNSLESGKLTDLSEMMNLNLNDYCNNFKTNRFLVTNSNEATEYFSSPSKSSTQEFSSPESSKFSSSATNCLVKEKNSSVFDESDNEVDKHITKLFVGNLPTSTTLPELLAVFKKFGPVNEALSVVKDHNYAFIHFYNRKDAEIALREVNDSLFKDRYIRVQFSTSQGFTNNKNKNFDKKKSFLSSPLHNIQSFPPNNNKQYVYSNQSIPYSYSSSMLSNGSYVTNNNIYGTKNIRPITGNRLTNSHTMTFFDKNASKQSNSAFQTPVSSQSNLLIEASKLQNLKLNPYSQYHDELHQKQQLIQALYLRQQQQLLQQQIQQQLQIQLQQSSQDELQQHQQFKITKSNTIGNFNLNYNSLTRSSSSGNLKQNGHAPNSASNYDQYFTSSKH